MKRIVPPESEADRCRAVMKRKLKEGVAATGFFAMVAHALFGTMALPLYCMEHEPTAPITKMFVFCISSFGGSFFLGCYVLFFFWLFCWSFNHVVTAAQRGEKGGA